MRHLLLTVCLAGCAGSSAGSPDSGPGSPDSGPDTIAFTETSHDFGAVVLGANGTAITFTLQNKGDGTGPLSTVVAGDSGDFTIADQCAGRSLRGLESCTVAVSFSPQHAEQRAAAVVVSAAGVFALLQLSGVGLKPSSVSADATAHEFGIVDVGHASQVDFHLHNSGDAASGPIAAAVAGDTGDFAVHDGCAPALLAGGATCAISVSFAPLTHGAKKLSLTAGGSAIALAGMGRDFVPLAVGLTGDGGGAVSGGGIECSGASCAGSYPRTDTFQTVTLTATPAQRSSFAAWGLDCSGTSACTLVMDRPRSVTAGFALLPAALSLDSGAAHFPITDVGMGANAEKTFTLTNTGGATSAPIDQLVTGDTGDFQLSGCAGAALAGGAWCTLHVAFTPQSHGAKAASASLSGVPLLLDGVGRDYVSLTVTFSGDGTGSFAGDGLHCADQICVGSYARTDSVATVTITAIPDPSSTFFYWYPLCTGNQPSCTVTMDEDHLLQANFLLKHPVLTLHERLHGGGLGAISSSPAVVSCVADVCTSSAMVDYGTRITLTAAPHDGSLFHWTGDCHGAAAACEVEMTADRSVTGIFSATNYAFVTSTAIASNFGALSAADAECAARASVAGLPGTYVAWVSNSTTPAATRLGTASGWIRVDGLPFAASQFDLLQRNQVFYPLSVDETGASAFVTVMTGTDPAGQPFLPCKDWTSTSFSDSIIIGISTQGPIGWTDAGGSACGDDNGHGYLGHLDCFGTDLQATVAVEPTDGRKAFVTSGLWTPGGGLAAADAFCAAEASASHLAGTFAAFLATTAQPASARFDMSPSASRWVRTDGIPVVAQAADLVAGDLLAPIAADAAGNYPPLAYYAWTGAQYPGDLAVLAENCQDWTVGTSASEAWMGEYAETNADYFSINAVFGPSTLTFKADCSRQLHLYCLER